MTGSSPYPKGGFFTWAWILVAKSLEVTLEARLIQPPSFFPPDPSPSPGHVWAQTHFQLIISEYLEVAPRPCPLKGLLLWFYYAASLESHNSAPHHYHGNLCTMHCACHSLSKILSHIFDHVQQRVEARHSFVSPSLTHIHLLKFLCTHPTSFTHTLL